MLYYLIPLGVLGVLALYLIGLFNRLVVLRNRGQEAWSDIEVQLKRRHDLIPNLVQTVKGYASHESGVFEKVTQARSVAMGAQGMEAKAEAENMLSNTLKSLFAVSEAYPELKASENFLELQRELRDTEDKVQASRRFYNTNIRDLNIALEKFPTNMIAPSFGFKKMEFFEVADTTQKEAPKIEF